MPILLAHKLIQKLSEVRRDKTLPWVRPDGKSQVSVRYEDNKPTKIETIVLSTQHAPEISQEEIARDLPSIPLFANGYWYSFNTQYWDGWPTEETNVMPPLAMWAFGSTGLLQQLLWSLNQNVGQTLPAVTSDINSEITDTNDGAFSNIFITAVILCQLIIYRKRSIKGF